MNKFSQCPMNKFIHWTASVGGEVGDERYLCQAPCREQFAVLDE